MTVGELRRRLGGAEFVQWIAYYEEKSARHERAYSSAQKNAERTAKRDRLSGRRV